MTGCGEEALVIPCQDDHLVAIHHTCGGARTIGVIIIVGGPQYRIGSHRQFLELSRYLSANGVPALRFDYRGMGDSGGKLRGFEHIDTDIRMAIDAFIEREPGLSGIILWGLCDAASAAMMYASEDERVRGLVLANPWVHTEASEARTRLRHYYLARLFSRDLWRKVLSGRFEARASLSGIASHIRSATKRSTGSQECVRAESRPHFVERMRKGLERFKGPVFLVLSGKDLTADEFRDLVAGSRKWRRLIRDKVTETLDLKEANHTFSTSDAKRVVESKTLEWVRMVADTSEDRAA